MKLLIVLTAFLLPAMLGACASKPVEPPKFSVNGFSFFVPPKDGWAVIKETPDLVALGKPGDFTGESLSIQMVGVKLAGQSGEALLREIRNGERQALDPNRFRILLQDVKPYSLRNLACVLSLLEVEDRAPSGPTGPVMSLVVESMTLTCPHPADPTLGVSLAYVHQAYPEDKGRLFADKAMPILNSLVAGETL